MQAIIHIEVANQAGTEYHQPIIQWSKEQFPELVTFDLDNFSEPAIINYAIDLVKHVDKLVVIIEAREEAGAGPLLKFMEELVSHKNKKGIFLILNGKNALLERMGRVLGPDRFLAEKDMASQKEFLKKHFS